MDSTIKKEKKAMVYIESTITPAFQFLTFEKESQAHSFVQKLSNKAKTLRSFVCKTY